MQSTKGISYDIGYSVGYFFAATWPFLLIGLAAFIAFVAFKYWNKRKRKATS